MAIEINGLPPSATKRPDAESAAPVQREQPGSAQGEQNRPSPTDAISLTDISTRLQDVEKKLAALPVVDSQRVEDTQRALAEGSHQIDAATIASKFVAFESLLDKK